MFFNTGCYIEADKQVGVCAYLKLEGVFTNNTTNSSQTCIPGIKQTISNTLITLFTSQQGSPNLQSIHYALIITPTLTRDNTKVSIGGTLPTDLTGGDWIENTTAGMSFYFATGEV